MFNLGYSISYPELRKFLTSAAEHGMNSHEKMIGLLSKMFEGTFLDPFDTKQRLTVSKILLQEHMQRMMWKHLGQIVLKPARK
ncbi:hypothetical protein DPMN_061367 [Dreissena polymorpha]|uniref:Uncharacterized protein n=1 Tax=Dreissena polymorpha TaxID=45954 RepID=A0A9D4HH29_DREPO|nr:hypothetical protein DPMN_061367 [Dreissena polymorpha]